MKYFIISTLLVVGALALPVADTKVSLVLYMLSVILTDYD